MVQSDGPCVLTLKRLPRGTRVVGAGARVTAGRAGRAVVRLDDRELSKNARRQIRARNREIDHRLRAIIDGGIADGSIASCDPKIAAFILAGAVNWMASWYEPRGPMDINDIVKQYIRLLSTGLSGESELSSVPAVPRLAATLRVVE